MTADCVDAGARAAERERAGAAVNRRSARALRRRAGVAGPRRTGQHLHRRHSFGIDREGAELTTIARIAPNDSQQCAA